jgi:signal transduction histidine kinase
MKDQFVPRLLDGEQMILLEDFAACLARALGTPLAVLALAAESLARRPSVPEAVRRDAATILVQTHRIAEVMRFLLDAADTEHVIQQQIDVNELMTEAVHLVRSSLHQRGVEPALILDTRPVRIIGDALLLKQAVLDLVEDRQAPSTQLSHGGRVEVRSRHRNGFVEIAVTTLHSAASAACRPEDRLTLWREDGSPGRLWRAWQFTCRQRGQLEVRAAGDAAVRVLMRLPAENQGWRLA